ncbi:hypothetical protein THAOC_20326, partial [Thalassiosira oceanica]
MMALRRFSLVRAGDRSGPFPGRLRAAARLGRGTRARVSWSRSLLGLGGEEIDREPAILTLYLLCRGVVVAPSHLMAYSFPAKG